MLVLFDFAAFLPSSTCKARSPSLNTEYANAEYPLKRESTKKLR